jgi:ATP-dependent DNA ligase
MVKNGHKFRHHFIFQVLTKGLEGLVLKNINGIYEPGKRHWLKVKKDYLFEGQMADSADLVVIGAWYGKFLVHFPSAYTHFPFKTIRLLQPIYESFDV